MAAWLQYAFIYFSETELIKFSSEGGTIEWLTAFIFGLVGVLALSIFYIKRNSLWLYFFLAMAFACMREMDLHKAWTTDSILKSNFYTDGTVPFVEKIIGGTVIFILLFTAFNLSKYIPYWVKSILHIKAKAWIIGFGLIFITIAKLIDSMARWLPILADFKADNSAFLGFTEENLEMAGAFLFLLVCLVGTKEKH